MLVGKSDVRGKLGNMRAFNPATGAELDPEFGAGGDTSLAADPFSAEAASLGWQELLPAGSAG